MHREHVHLVHVSHEGHLLPADVVHVQNVPDQRGPVVRLVDLADLYPDGKGREVLLGELRQAHCSFGFQVRNFLGWRLGWGHVLGLFFRGTDNNW